MSKYFINFIITLWCQGFIENQYYAKNIFESIEILLNALENTAKYNIYEFKNQ